MPKRYSANTAMLRRHTASASITPSATSPLLPAVLLLSAAASSNDAQRLRLMSATA